jgi:hypothetical protein
MALSAIAIACILDLWDFLEAGSRDSRGRGLSVSAIGAWVRRPAERDRREAGAAGMWAQGASLQSRRLEPSTLGELSTFMSRNAVPHAR